FSSSSAAHRHLHSFPTRRSSDLCVLAGIHLTDVPSLVYERELFYEKQVRSVTANTRADGEEFLRLAGTLGIVPRTHTRPLAEAADTLTDLAADRYEGAAVLVP